METMRREWKGTLQLGQRLGVSIALSSRAVLAHLEAIYSLLHAFQHWVWNVYKFCKGGTFCCTCAGEGTSSGRWDIVGSLGEGGYAEVYQVRDTSTVEAPQVCPF